MATKMKGLFKGLRYISQIFEEKHKEMQIGGPTDVKHVAHIGWEGPSALDSPSWMKEFKSTNGVHSAPLTVTGEPQQNDQVKWVSQDSHRIPRGRISPDQLITPSQTRHNSTREVSALSDDQDHEFSRKNKNSRKNTGKDSSSQRSRSARQPINSGSDSPVNQEDLKKTRSTRQPKERVHGSDCSDDQEGSRRTRSTRQPKVQNSGSDSPPVDPEGSVKARRKSKESGSDNSVDPEGSVKSRKKSKESGSDNSVDPEGSVKARKKSKESGADNSVDPEGSRRTRSSRQQRDQNSGSESAPDPEGSVKTRKKPKESVNGVSVRSKSKAPLPPTSPLMDLGPDPQSENMGGSYNIERDNGMY